MTTDTGLVVSHVTVRYPGAAAPALDDASLDVPAGHICALLGPSGSGKSTMLAAIAGLVPIEAGSVEFAGTDLTPVATHRRGVGMVFQDGLLFPHRNVAANIGFALDVARTPRAERARRVAAMLELVGLAGYGNRAITQLSGGERQRVALARSLAPSPRVLLLDEPLSSLDSETRVAVGDAMVSAIRATGTTTILVTHDEDEASRLCDTTTRIATGRI